uniref:Reverse transcriptase domain-containing protein n=1 Tax=Cannabis sativa TaxID=3483 RepID=A0A803Q5P9_CANSA
MTHFQSFVSKFSLLPLNPIGSKYTWKHGSVCERLDWGVVNHIWQHTFPHTTLYHLGFYGSDHRVLKITLNDVSMKTCVDDIKNWNARFNSLSRRIHALESSINAIHSNLPLSSDKIQQASALQSQLDSLLYKNEILSKQQSKIHWLQAGDKNTKYFHRRCPLILVIFVSLRSLIAKLLNISFLPLISHQIQFLDSPFEAHEVRQALFQVSGDKAPGLDGLNPAFYQKNWHIMGNDLTTVILDTLNNMADFSSINETLIVLIPNKSNASSLKDFRPISLCSTIYKIISKMLSNRLKSVLGDLISPFQGAFLSERIIFNNIFIAQEVVHAINHRKHGKFGWVGLKLDMEKAFDRVEWDFLLAILNKFKFPIELISLIHQCISSATIRFSINGQITNSLHPSRGIRQGDPLSPYLFLLCSEGLTAALRLQEQSGSFRGISVARTAPPVSHLLFADDTLLFTVASPSSCNALKEALNAHHLATGLEPRPFISKYLGVPQCFGRSKKSNFDFLLQKVSSQLSIWNGKLFSKAGKEVLLKAVIQAIPSYTMPCFKLPASFCHKIERLMAQFWWGSMGKGSKIHWKNWRTLCSSKFFGGLGFRDLLIRGLLWKVGNGCSIRTLQDPWIPGLKFPCLRSNDLPPVDKFQLGALKGLILLSGTKKIQPSMAEALSLRASLEWCINIQIPLAVVETDSKVLVDKVHSKKVEFSALSDVVEDIRCFLSTFPNVHLRYISITINCRAHGLARRALGQDEESCWNVLVPTL